MPDNDIAFFAKTNYRNAEKKFGIKTDDRRRHMYFIGKTGMGKSVTLENLIMNDIEKGNGLAVVDPHGDTVEKILDYIPNHRINDVIYFNPADLDFPIAFNILETVDPSVRHIVASGLIGVFKKIWADSWGPRLEYVLRNVILALLDYPGSTLLGIMRMLTDKAYRKKVISMVQDPVVKSFWVDEFSKYPDKFAVEAVSPIQNKVGQFLSNALIRNIVGQVKSTIDMRTIMDGGKILLMNLSKGRIGEDTSSLMGPMMITKIQLAAMSRVDMEESARRDFYLYVDEFQNFATESFANILSEARKYHLNLTIAHQYIEQLNEKVVAAVFGNVGTLVCFRVGAIDAEELVKEFSPVYTAEDLVNLPKYNIILRLMIDGITSEPFSATTIEPINMVKDKTGNREKIIKVSRERYANSRAVIEEKIVRWSGVSGLNMVDVSGGIEVDNGKNSEKKKKSDAPKSAIVQTRVAPEPGSLMLAKIAEAQAKNGIAGEKIFTEGETVDEDGPTKDRKYPAQCWSCNKLTHVSFEPDGKRPIYCKACLRESRQKKAEALKEAGSLAEKFPLSNIKEQINTLNNNQTSELSLAELSQKNPVLFGGRKENPAVQNSQSGKQSKNLIDLSGDK